MRFIAAFLQFWYDFIVGDDWKIAVAVVAALCAAGALLAAGTSTAVLLPITGVLIMAAFTAAIIIDVRAG
jgi:hypothetical protein